MKNEVFETKELTADNGKVYSLNYNLISIDIVDENYKNSTAYGIEIEKFLDQQLKEKDFIYAISNNKQKVISLLKILSEGKVTPMSLVNVVDDYIV